MCIYFMNEATSYYIIIKMDGVALKRQKKQSGLPESSDTCRACIEAVASDTSSQASLYEQHIVPSSVTSATKFDLLYIGKLDLPYHPVRMRYHPYSRVRYLLYGKNGYQGMTVNQDSEIYSLQEISWETLACDCVQTMDSNFYVIARSHTSSVLAVYDEFMFVKQMAEIAYPQGCLSSITADRSCRYIYGTNPELNCVQRFSSRDHSMDNPQRFGALFRPFDCCTSQTFNGGKVQFLFISNLDAGICVFDLADMRLVAECGDDLSPGAKYLAYDPARCLLFVSSSCDRLLRCYRFEYETSDSPKKHVETPVLHKLGDYMAASRMPADSLSCGPQCVMWDPELDRLAVVSWSETRSRFCVRLFIVNVV